MKTNTVIAALAMPAAAFTSTAFGQAPTIVKSPTNQGRNFAIRLLSLLRGAILAAAALLAGVAFAQTPVGVPSKVVGAYFTEWSLSSGADHDPMNIRDVPQDANVIFLFRMVPNVANGDEVQQTGTWSWPYGTPSDPETLPACASNVTTCTTQDSLWPSREDVQFVRARGQKVILTLGSGGHSYRFDSRAATQGALDAIRALIDNQFGPLDGINLNTFEGTENQTPRATLSLPSEITWLIEQLRAQYGSGFALILPPGGGTSPPDADLQLAVALNNSNALTFVAPQFYDSTDSKQPDAIRDSMSQWVAALGPTKVAIGLSANYNDQFFAATDAEMTSSPTLSESKAAWDGVVAQFPSIRGVTAWTAQYNHRGGNQWTAAMGPRVLGSPSKIQAEDGTWSGSGMALNTTDIPGYEGSGFLSWFSDPGDQMSISFPNVGGGTYDIHIRYATWSTAQQQNTLVVNGASSSQMFPGTSTSWVVKTVSGVTLAPGTNVIGITKDWGWIGVDYIEIVPAASPVRIQAENGSWSGSGMAVNTTDIAGYEGTGFLSWFSDPGDQMSISFPNLAGGTYNINIRYATWSTSQQQNTLVVNGASSSQMFPGTSSTWVVKTISGVTLAPGTNVIGITKDWGFIGVDYIEITK